MGLVFFRVPPGSGCVSACLAFSIRVADFRRMLGAREWRRLRPNAFRLPVALTLERRPGRIVHGRLCGRDSGPHQHRCQRGADQERTPQAAAHHPVRHGYFLPRAKLNEKIRNLQYLVGAQPAITPWYDWLNVRLGIAPRKRVNRFGNFGMSKINDLRGQNTKKSN